MESSRLHQLSAHGVSVWVDSLSREMLATGELERLIEEARRVAEDKVAAGADQE